MKLEIAVGWVCIFRKRHDSPLERPVYSLMQFSKLAALVLSVGLATACSVDAPPDAGYRVVADAGIDGGVVSVRRDGGALGACPPMTDRPNSGLVSVQPSGGGVIISADFPARGPDFFSPLLGCAGPCEVRPGYVVDAGLPADDPAGDLVVTGVGTSTIVIEPAPFPNYAHFEPSTLIAAGTPVTVAATGHPDGVPVFRRTVSAAADVIVNQPVFGGAPVVAPRDRPLEVRWTLAPQNAGGEVVVRLFGDAFNPVPRNAFAVRCRYPASAGVVEVPAEILSLFAPGRVQTNVQIETSTHAPAGPYEIWLKSIGAGAVSGDLMLQ